LGHEAPEKVNLFLHDDNERYGAFTGDWSGSSPRMTKVTMGKLLKINLKKTIIKRMEIDHDICHNYQNGGTQELCFWQTQEKFINNCNQNVWINVADVAFGPTVKSTCTDRDFHCLAPELITFDSMSILTGCASTLDYTCIRLDL
jgi:hypothetical protein